MGCIHAVELWPANRKLVKARVRPDPPASRPPQNTARTRGHRWTISAPQPGRIKAHSPLP